MIFFFYSTTEGDVLQKWEAIPFDYGQALIFEKIVFFGSPIQVFFLGGGVGGNFFSLATLVSIRFHAKKEPW